MFDEPSLLVHKAESGRAAFCQFQVCLHRPTSKKKAGSENSWNIAATCTAVPPSGGIVSRPASDMNQKLD